MSNFAFQTDPLGKPAHLVSTARLTPGDFASIARQLGVAPFRARKTGFVSARQASRPERIVTLWNGKESEVDAAPGDWIVANMPDGRTVLRDGQGNANVYAIRAAKFPALYERDRGATEFGDVYKAKTTVAAIQLPGGFDIVAPWGEAQRGDRGYILMNGADVYGNHQDTFEATYVRIEA